MGAINSSLSSKKIEKQSEINNKILSKKLFAEAAFFLSAEILCLAIQRCFIQPTLSL